MFKNLTIYKFDKAPNQLNDAIYSDADALHDALSKKAFTDCTASQRESMGWVTPLGKKATAFTHQSGNYLSLRR